ncbi:MAG: hypothetical protein WBM24_08660 [Candidatus Sulfotelmatobacter sp.]
MLSLEDEDSALTPLVEALDLFCPASVSSMPIRLRPTHTFCGTHAIYPVVSHNGGEYSSGHRPIGGLMERQMTTYPVYEVGRHDFTADCQPIGQAATEDEAMALLARYFDASDAPAKVELADRDVGSSQLRAYWPVWG